MLSSIHSLKLLQAGVTHHTAGPGIHPLDTLWYSDTTFLILITIKSLILAGGDGMVVQAFNPSAQKAETGGSQWVWGQPGLQSEFQDRLQSYTEKTCLEKQNKEQTNKKNPYSPRELHLHNSKSKWMTWQYYLGNHYLRHERQHISLFSNGHIQIYNNKNGRFTSCRGEKQTLPGIQETEEPGVTHLAEQNPTSWDSKGGDSNNREADLPRSLWEGWRVRKDRGGGSLGRYMRPADPSVLASYPCINMTVPFPPNQTRGSFFKRGRPNGLRHIGEIGLGLF